MSGYVGDLSPKQEKILLQFKENVDDVLTKYEFDDHYLLKWLRARWWDQKKAEKMLRDSLKWREREGADTILQDWDPPEVLKKYFPGGLLCYDKEGCPVWLDLVGHTDLKGLLYSARKQDIMKLKIQHCELLQNVFKDQSDKLGKRVDKVILIHDLENFGLRHLWKPGMDLLAEILGFIEANYPESLKYCFVVNAPKLFPIAYNIVKPFLNDDTKKKVQVLGRNWKSKLLEHIDPLELPLNWGGKVTDPDGNPYCKSRMSLGGEVPKSYYLQDSLIIDPESFGTLTVGRGSSVKVEYEVTTPGSVIRWQFKTEGYDIGFGIFKKTDPKQQKSAEMEEVVSTERFNSHMVPEDGMVTIKEPGTYVIRFDNTYSWVNTKKVHYLVEVLNQDEEDEFYDALDDDANGNSEKLVVHF